MPDQVVIVMEDREAAAELETLLKGDGYLVSIADDGTAGLELIRSTRPELAIMDLRAPGLSGLEILRGLGPQSSRPATRFVMLASDDSEVDRILAFELGADDFVARPFNARELLLRLRAVLKRHTSHPWSVEDVLEAGPIRLDPLNFKTMVHGKQISLTLTEYQLLAQLMRARGRVRSREDLLSALRGSGSSIQARTVDTHIRRLRVKLGKAARHLRTVRGVGYRIDPGELRRASGGLVGSRRG
jgi:two-component system phosphate regulon response regulator PhoB